MEIEAGIWDKHSPVNGRDAAFLSEHFKGQNGNDDRILIAFDGVVQQIQYLDDAFFTTKQRDAMDELIQEGMSRPEAICEIWKRKATEERSKIDKEVSNIAKAQADIDYIAMMAGVDLNV